MYMPNWSWVKLRDSVSILCDDENYSRSDEDAILSNVIYACKVLIFMVPFPPITIDVFVQDINLEWYDGNSHDVVEIAVQNGGGLQVVGTARLDCDNENGSLPSPCVAVEILAISFHEICFLILQRSHSYSGLWKRVGVGWTNLTRW